MLSLLTMLIIFCFAAMLQLTCFSANSSHPPLLSMVDDDMIPEKADRETTELVITAVALLLTCPFIILGNLLVIVVIRRTPALHTMANLLAANLAVADIFMGLKTIPTIISLFYPDEYNTYYACCTSYFQWVFTCNANGLLLIGEYFGATLNLIDSHYIDNILHVRAGNSS